MMSKMLDVDTLAKSGQSINVNGGLQIKITQSVTNMSVNRFCLSGIVLPSHYR